MQMNLKVVVVSLAGSMLMPFVLGAQNVDFTSNKVCFGKQTTLAGTSVHPDSSVSTWKWDLDDDGQYDDATGKLIYHTFTSADTFKVSLRISLKNGSADSTPGKDVIVNPVPDVNFHVDNLCEGKAAVYTDQSSVQGGSISQYKWDFNNDGIVDDISGPVVKYTCGPASGYVTRLEVVTDKNCSSFATKNTRVYNQPVAGFSVAAACLGDSVPFSNTSAVAGDTIAWHIWDFGDGSQGLMSNGNIKHLYASAQTYNARLIVVTNNYCRDTAYKAVTVNAAPSLSIQVSGDTIIYQGQSMELEAIGAGTFLWNTGAVTSKITVTQSGNYSVVLTDGNGCTASALTGITVKEIDDSVQVKNNILTPSVSDGINDFLEIEDLEAYQACEVKIYNLWGDEVYSSAKYDNKWAGTDRGGNALEGGSYYYVIRCDDKLIKKGNINILR